MNLRVLLLTATLALLGAATADAAIEIRVHDANVSANGPGFVEVYLSSTDDIQLQLSSFDLLVGIENVGAPGGYYPDSTLEFVDFDVPPPQYPYVGDSNYVFHDATVAGPSGNTVDPDGLLLATHWYGFDAVDVDPYYVDLLPNQPYLLARLKVTHFSPNDASGQKFTVSLGTIVLGSGSVSSMYDEDDNTILFTSTPGIVTIQGAAPIPEPSSLLVFAGLALCAVPFLRRRTRQKCRT